MKPRHLLTLALACTLTTASAQTELYPKHFNLEEVTLLDGPMRTAMELNFKVLLDYDVDRLLTPYVRQAGLSATTDTQSKYYQWTTRHPSFTNWGDNSFNLEGHVGGHYLSALALAYAACHDSDMRQRMKARMDYMVGVMKDCQDQYDNDNSGLRGFIGGQPINSDWTALYQGNTEPFSRLAGTLQGKYRPPARTRRMGALLLPAQDPRRTARRLPLRQQRNGQGTLPQTRTVERRRRGQGELHRHGKPPRHRAWRHERVDA